MTQPYRGYWRPYVQWVGMPRGLLRGVRVQRVSFYGYREIKFLTPHGILKFRAQKRLWPWLRPKRRFES